MEGRAELTCSLESNMIYVILSPLYEEYGDPVLVNWMLTAFMLTSFGAAAIVGRLGDVFGRRRMMMVMLVVAAFGSMLSALSNDLIIVIVGRAFQGATMGILPLCYGVLPGLRRGPRDEGYHVARRGLCGRFRSRHDPGRIDR